MEHLQTGSRYAHGEGDFLAHGHCTAQPETINMTNYGRSVGDDVMNDNFDFPGYYGEHQAHSKTTNYEDDAAATYQQSSESYRDEHRDEQSDSGPPGEVEDKDGCQNVLEASLASHYSSNPMKCSLIPLKSSSFEHDLVDPFGFIDLVQLAASASVEKWDVDKKTMEFLAAVRALSAPGDTLLTHCGMRPHFRDVKLEEPILSTDAATDMLRLREKNIVRLTSKGLRPYAPDKRHDQDLQWPTKSLSLPHDMDSLIAAEKMAVNRETGSFLKDIFEGMKGEPITPLLRKRQQEALCRPMTPPLLPMSPPYSPGSIPSTAARLPFTSTPEDPLVEERAELEAQMMATEDLGAMQVDGPQQEDFNPFKTAPTSSSSPLRRKFDKISDLKVSSPLLPCISMEPPTKKSKNVSFAEEISTLVPQRADDTSSTDPFVAADQALAAVSALLEPLAQPTMDQDSTEQLVEMDTTARVDVPSIEPLVPEAPWEVYLGRQHALLGTTRDAIFKAEKRWTGASSLERLLPWSPFPAHLGKSKPEGEFDDGSLARYLSELDIEEHVDLRQMMWKPEGLRVLDLDEEEELEAYALKHYDHSPDHVVPSHGTQIANMAQQDSTTSFHFSSTQLPRNQTAKLQRAMNTFPATQSKLPLQRSRETVPQDVRAEPNSMQALLEKRRVQLQHEKATLDAFLLSNVNNRNLSAFMAVQGVREIPHAPVPEAKRRKEKVESTRPVPTPTPSLEIPAPKILGTKSKFPVVVSATLVANRQLMRKLQQLLPSLEVNERESTIQTGKQTNPPNPAREADLTLSPSTGLMCTTLQKLKQRPLPGQEASFIGIRDQLIQVAPRYERLIVLVSEGSHSTTSDSLTHIRTLDERDSTAIADFIGFFSRFDSEVQVSYVPGGEEELAKWIAAAVTRWAAHMEGFNLLEEETVWERFLRKAGLNAFAAQVVLDQLKRPLSEVESEESMGMCCEEYGLAAFVRMSAEERVRRFGLLIGGEGMLRRVSRAVDGPWRVNIKER